MWLALVTRRGPDVPGERTDLRVTKKAIEDGGFPRAYVASPSDAS